MTVAQQASMLRQRALFAFEKEDLANAELSALAALFLQSTTDGWVLLAAIQGRSRRFLDAEDACRRALALSPNDVAALNLLGLALDGQFRWKEAKESYSEALRIAPDTPAVLNNLARVFREEGNYAEAESLLRRSLSRKPRMVEAWLGLALVYLHCGRLAEALTAAERALAHRPSSIDSHVIRSEILLAQGDYRRGWAEHEWRFRQATSASRPGALSRLHLRRWNGKPLGGKTLLVVQEGGFGDVLMLARFLPALKAKSGARRLFAGRKEVFPLLTAQGVIDAMTDELPNPRDIQHWVSMFSLPALLNIHSQAAIAEHYSAPYLTVPSDAIARWEPRFQRLPRRGLRVGLVWRGNDIFQYNYRRSCSLADMAPLASVPGVDFYSLQIGPASEKAQRPPAGMVLHDETKDIADFGDTAALISNLDLVITVDTSVAHLAGALGKPVWIALNSVPEWRWQQHLKQETSLWYPSARLFIQDQLYDWQPVFSRMAEALRQLVSERAAA